MTQHVRTLANDVEPRCPIGQVVRQRVVPLTIDSNRRQLAHLFRETR
jgi:hypothetical protein